MNCVIFGAGAWGTAVAIHLDRLGHTVTLVPRRMEQALKLTTERINHDYLPKHKLAHSIQVGLETAPALMDADIVFLACPSKGLTDLLKQIGPEIQKSSVKMVISLCKGLDQNSLQRPTELIQKVLGKIPAGTLSGPSNANEVAHGNPTAMVLASTADDSTLRTIQAAISGPTLRVYTSNDVAGVEIGGTLKNVYAIGAGLCDGLKLGDNAKAAFLTRALQEMIRVGVALGGKSETFLGLSGAGDLMATAHGSWSRNRTLGQSIAQNPEPTLSALKTRRDAVEGYRATEALCQLAKSHKLDAPILLLLQKILFEGLDARTGVTTLMTRDLKAEA